MIRRGYAFTLIELLATIAIVAIVAALVFPAMARARESAKQAVCVSNFRQAAQASLLYHGDYDDRMAPASYAPGSYASSRNDKTWVQLLLPYVRNFRVFFCPSDVSVRPKPEATFDQDLVPGDLMSQYYTASQRTNLGYNYLYLAPIVEMRGSYFAVPRGGSEFESPGNTFLFMDSVWSRDASGNPVGGGSWVVAPPCRFAQESGRVVDTFKAGTSADDGASVVTFGRVPGWESAEELSPLRYGGAWPWHSGYLTVARLDMSVSPMRPERLEEGCEVLPEWRGTITDPQRYGWDTR